MLRNITIIFGIVALLGYFLAKDLNKKIFLIMPFLFSFLVFLVDSFPSEPETKYTEPPTTYESTSTEQSEETTAPNGYESISSTEELTVTDGTISGAITQEEQHDSYLYTALTSGRYHFDFEYSDVNNPFWFSILDSTGECISESNSSDDSGVSVDLVQNETYNICIDEYSGLLESYSVKINEPTIASTIEGNSFSDSLSYIDQINTTYYKAPVTGTYRFTFDLSNVNNPFHFCLSNSKKELLAETHSIDGVTVELVKDELYTIIIEEYQGLLESYSVSIGVPKEPINITENQFGGSLDYIDQCDTYYYTAPRTGRYRFDFDSSNVNNPFYFHMYDSKMEEIGWRYSNNDGITMDLVKDETYEIHINESEGLLENYSVTVGVPKKTKTISKFPINGSITYTDQCDIYKYTAPYSGEYNFNFSIDDVNCSYDIIITAENEEQILNTCSVNSSRKIELNQNETYKIKIIQCSGYPIKYKITLD